MMDLAAAGVSLELLALLAAVALVAGFVDAIAGGGGLITVPALLLATGFENGGKAAWEHFLSTDYHQPSDDMNQPINWEAGANYARVGYLISREIADGATRPRWYAGDYFGTTFAPAAPKVARPATGGK